MNGFRVDRPLEIEVWPDRLTGLQEAVKILRSLDALGVEGVLLFADDVQSVVDEMLTELNQREGIAASRLRELDA